MPSPVEEASRPRRARADFALSALALLAAVAVFAWMAAAVVPMGLASADDAWTALTARSLADGRGYGAPYASDDFRLFDPRTTSGPPLVVPAAIAIRLLGARDALPGAVGLALFALQLALLAAVLNPRFGASATASFLAVALALLCALSARHWYFGVFIGETTAFGYLLLGSALLALGERRRAFAAAGLCFAAACLTKLLALFAVAGIVGVWLAQSLGRAATRRRAASRAAVLLASGLAPVALYQLVRLACLGTAGYRDRLGTATSDIRHLAFGDGEFADRLARFGSGLASFGPGALAVALAGIALALLAAGRREAPPTRRDAARLALLWTSGAVAHLLYILFVSTLWERYYWVGIALLGSAGATSLLGATPGRRPAALLAFTLTAILLRFDRPLAELHSWAARYPGAQERAAAVAWLESHPELPYAAESWASLLDLVYLRRDAGTWATGDDVARLSPRELVAAVHATFTSRESRFYRAVAATCEPLTPDARLIRLYRCGGPFWERYDAPASPEPAASVAP